MYEFQLMYSFQLEFDQEDESPRVFIARDGISYVEVLEEPTTQNGTDWTPGPMANLLLMALNSPSRLSCVYCGHEYPADTPPSGAHVQVLTDHIRQCPKHPMRSLETANTEMRSLLKRIRQWDHLLSAGDGPYWLAEINRVLEQSC